MEIIVLFTIAAAFIGVILLLVLLKRRVAKGEVQDAAEMPQRRPLPRGVAQARNARARMRVGARQDSEDEEEEEDGPLNVEFPDGKIGAKKRAKLEAKAERKAQREMEERGRLDKKKRQEQEEEDRQRASVKDHQEEERRLEEEHRALEEKERQEQEEYLKMKAMFSVEEEGYEEGEGEDSEVNLLQQFISYIKDMKVVVLEDLAAHFKLKTQNVIDRIHTLQTGGSLTGVVDDRGKFIYVSQEELEAVAKFVKQRGRVSIVDLAESSNQLVNLNSALNQLSTVN